MTYDDYVSQCRQLGYDAGMTKDQFEDMQKNDRKSQTTVLTKTGWKRILTLKVNAEMYGE